MVDWVTARSNCISWGGDLVSLRSNTEEKFITSLVFPFSGVRRRYYWYKSYWIGHHDRYNEASSNVGLFVSVGNSFYGYTNFYRKKPDTSGSNDCVKFKTGRWEDIHCSTKLDGYICGKPSKRKIV